MSKSEQQDQENEKAEMEQKPITPDGKCPKCGGDSIVLTELMKDNRIVRQRQCKKCGKVFLA